MSRTTFPHCESRNPLARWALLAFGAALALGASGCATVRTAPAPQATAAAATPAPIDQSWEDSTLDIHYTLGHLRRHIHMEATRGQPRAQLLVDRTLLKENTIDATHYREFLHKVADFIEQKRTPAGCQANPDCRSPYTINLRSGKDARVLNGCRVSEEGSFAHLVRDSEFLVYSQ